MATMLKLVRDISSLEPELQKRIKELGKNGVIVITGPKGAEAHIITHDNFALFDNLLKIFDSNPDNSFTEKQMEKLAKFLASRKDIDISHLIINIANLILQLATITNSADSTFEFEVGDQDE